MSYQMKSASYSTKKLQDFCKSHDIAVPKTASREQIEATIARSYLHQCEAESHEKFGCYGFYSQDDMNCKKFCSNRESCFKDSLGTTEKSLERFEKSVLKVRFSDPIKRGRR